MHHLLKLVLEQKDLSRAGELFSLDDSEIEGCLSEALEQIKLISSSPDYQTNDNDQAVVEICVTRITSAIRETESIEKHGKALIDLWESCLEHNLKPFCKDEDTPHAKIASDIMSCILQNYNRPPIIALAVPVAVKFLQRGNKELCRNLSSYLSLAAISKAELLAEHTESIVKSILQGKKYLYSTFCIPPLVPRLFCLHSQTLSPFLCLHCRSQSLVVHAGHMKDIHTDSKGEEENGDVTASISFTDLYLSQETDKLPSSAISEESQLEQPSLSRPSIKCSEPENLPEPVKENCHEENPKIIKNPMEYQDKLYFHLKENLSKVKAYVMEMGKKIPFPDECLIEDTVKSCVAKLSFICPLKGHYCLYSKSGFTLISHQPQLWIHIMFLFQQGLFPEPLSMQNNYLQILKILWGKTQLKGTHSFETAMVQSTFPHKKDLDHVQSHLEEVRFFDLFSYNEEAGAWQCFMCNNPDKATVVNQDGQPLIEGRLKEKQIRWKFIKKWKTRYFTLAGNQLLFHKGKSKDDPDDCPIELSKVQSVKVVAKKRRDRSLPRAFEIFTDNKTYVFKAKDEKNAEEWLQCINVAVAQAKERESREATTYL
ncbi:PREDICTED: ventricular zone-expressed PH domain-containing protein homolog 1 [Thamnophis sirtalis]|uniref:Ventricular zone-expressed PH domain-containing protein homolog 1 n=1 Tax=Thamnophis sirtalis TaxID=35019 RepID=A0A6I9XFH7_9SAUR|nr:PREDICTED: ventricular zone-expressed PH domain-containing protein homolog 1 [Thamnophis sirtalis]